MISTTVFTAKTALYPRSAYFQRRKVPLCEGTLNLGPTIIVRLLVRTWRANHEAAASPRYHYICLALHKLRASAAPTRAQCRCIQSECSTNAGSSSDVSGENGGHKLVAESEFAHGNSYLMQRNAAVNLDFGDSTLQHHQQQQQHGAMLEHGNLKSKPCSIAT
jgi:hypothetical protein